MNQVKYLLLLCCNDCNGIQPLPSSDRDSNECSTFQHDIKPYALHPQNITLANLEATKPRVAEEACFSHGNVWPCYRNHADEGPKTVRNHVTHIPSPVVPKPQTLSSKPQSPNPMT